jgi:hypothetical protein
VRRFVFAPRWVLGHVLILVTVVSCLLLARWQWDVSQHTHSLQNLAYALQWPMFAVFFAVMWYRMLRLESQRLDEEAEPAAEVAPAGSGSAVEPDPRGRPPVDAPLLTPPPGAPTATPDDEDLELAAYNRMLAELAVRDQAG